MERSGGVMKAKKSDESDDIKIAEGDCAKESLITVSRLSSP